MLPPASENDFAAAAGVGYSQYSVYMPAARSVSALLSQFSS